MHSFLRRTIRLLFAFVAGATGTSAGAVSVAASFTIPADIAANVGGERVKVRSLTPPNSDFHAMQPTPAQVRALAEADLVVAVHPQVESWIAALEAAGTLKRPVLYLARGIIPEIPPARHKHARHAPGCTCGAHGEDAHVWTDPAQVAVMGEVLAERLAAIDPQNAPAHRAAGAAYAERMKKLAADMERELAAIPEPRRKLFSQHNNLSHFAKRFRFTIAGTLLQSSSSEAADPSAKTMSRIVADIRASGTPAVFADNTLSSELLTTVARDAGLPPPVRLYTDALDAPGTPAASYEGMMRENARRIAAALAVK